MTQEAHVSPPKRRRTRVDLQAWAVEIVNLLRQEYAVLAAQLAPSEREASGELWAWSTKDEIAHLAYWIALFATNIAAARADRPLTDTRPYLAMNDAAWHERAAWDWTTVEQALLRAIDAVAAQLATLSSDELRDAGRLTVEPAGGPPRPLIRSLLYELIDHPLHHFAGIYQRLGAAEPRVAMLARVAALVEQPGVRTLAGSTRAKLRSYRQR